MQTFGDRGRPLRAARRLVAATVIAAALMAPAVVGPPAALAAGWGCNAEPPGQTFYNGRWPQTSISEAGAAASIDPSSTLSACTTPFFATAAAAWVGIVPGVGNSHDNDGTAIIQAGVYSENLWDGSLHNLWFIAYGGCNGVQPTAHILEGVHVPAFDWAVHRFVVVATSIDFQIYFDGWQVYNSVDDPAIWNAIKCWTDETKDIAVTGEKINHASRYSIETSSTTFANIQKKYSGSWTSLTGTACEAVNTTTPHRDYCAVITSGQGLMIWTDDN
ncbi:MAG TPA: hypothetical protein VGQ64_01865 [Candidatus Limnocylindrales bacterium]|jgi:hypothetical protein|nr:hypothetical protein [Candidatus Limnocylindrales bacterium]